MKKLFLSSYFVFVSDLLLPLLSKKPTELTLAFIPTAADLYPIKPWFYLDKLKLKMMGFSMIDIDLKNKTSELLYEDLKHVDVIFVSGGNTYYLLEKAQKSGFLEIVKRLVSRGVVYIGSSAGSALACSTIEYIEDFDDKNAAELTDYKGMNLVDFLILPHYGNKKHEERFKRIIKTWKNKKYKIQAIADSQVYIINDNVVNLYNKKV